MPVAGQTGHERKNSDVPPAVQRPSFTQLREHLTQLFKDLQQRRQRESNNSQELVQFHSHASVPVGVAGSSRTRGEVQGTD